MRTLAILVFVYFVTSAVVSAQSDSVVWKKLSTPAGEITFSVPSDFLARNDAENHSVYYRGGAALIRVSVEADPKAKEKLARYRINAAPPRAGVKNNSFTIGEFEGDFHVSEDGRYAIWFEIASKLAYYSISAWAPTADNPVLVRFMNSVRLGDRPLAKQSSPSEDKTTATDLTTLGTSPAIARAMSRKVSENIPVEYIEAVADDAHDAGTKPVYERPLLILFQPKADFHRGSRSESVNLKIVLLADGSVGRIKVIGQKHLNRFAHQAVKAALAIKFLPPEQDGKPVEIEVPREYTYEVYDGSKGK